MWCVYQRSAKVSYFFKQYKLKTTLNNTGQSPGFGKYKVLIEVDGNLWMKNILS